MSTKTFRAATTIAALCIAAASACALPSNTVSTTADHSNPGSGGGTGVGSSSATGAAANATAGAGEQSTAPTSRLATVGDSITLTGQNDEKISVTLVKILAKAAPANDFEQPESGKHYAAVQFRITNTGSVPFSDAPDNDAKVIDTAGEAFEADITDTTAGASLSGTVNIAPGDSQLGYVTFQVADAATLAKVQFTIDSGFGDTAQWSVR